MMNEKTTAGPACDLATGPVITYTAKMIWLYNIMLVEKMVTVTEILVIRSVYNQLLGDFNQ